MYGQLKTSFIKIGSLLLTHRDARFVSQNIVHQIFQKQDQAKKYTQQWYFNKLRRNAFSQYTPVGQNIPSLNV